MPKSPERQGQEKEMACQKLARAPVAVDMPARITQGETT